MASFRFARDLFLGVIFALAVAAAGVISTKAEKIPDGNERYAVLALAALASTLLPFLGTWLIAKFPSLRRRMFGQEGIEGYWAEVVLSNGCEPTVAVLRIFWEGDGLRVVGHDYNRFETPAGVEFKPQATNYSDGSLRMSGMSELPDGDYLNYFSVKTFQGSCEKGKAYYSGAFASPKDFRRKSCHVIGFRIDDKAELDKANIVDAYRRGRVPGLIQEAGTQGFLEACNEGFKQYRLVTASPSTTQLTLQVATPTEHDPAQLPEEA
ncbi:MAG: hypothetical protein ACO1SV_21660 [Fimbriimonas sp.]